MYGPLSFVAIMATADPQVFTFKPEIVQKNLVNHGPQ